MDPSFDNLPLPQLQRMLAAGEDILECYRVLRKTGGNVVAEILRGQGTFYRLNHYPAGDVIDLETHSQYYYHAHRAEEHGHFHTFLRPSGMPAEVRPVGGSADPAGASRGQPCHLIALSMDVYGHPRALFTTNRWVTDETWYAAADVAIMVDRFLIDHACPSWPTNRWISGMLRLFQPQVVTLPHERDRKVAAWTQANPESDVFEDRRLETITERAIDVEAQIAAVRQALRKRDRR